MRRVLVSVPPLVAAAVLYLLLWPVRVEPVAWDAPRAPPPPAAPDTRLAAAERIGRGAVPGPESIAIAADGRPYAGTADGRIVRAREDGTVETWASTGGRPLGIEFAPDGTLWVADAARGLLAVSPSGEVRVAATEHGGVRFGFTDDVAIGPDGTVYFTDASTRFGYGEAETAVLEHRNDGRLLAHEPASGATRLLAGGLHFANGVALNSDATWIAVTETSTYRVLRHWLAGSRRGTTEVLADNLPGFPDNITYSPARRVFWIALFSPRVAAADLLAPHPFLRKVVARLPRALRPAPIHHAAVVAMDDQGRVVDRLEDASASAYAPVTSALEHGGWIWLGSLTENGIARVRAP